MTRRNPFRPSLGKAVLLALLTFQPSLWAAETNRMNDAKPEGAGKVQIGLVDGGEIVFDKQKWVKRNLSLQLIPWHGEKVVFLTTTNPLVPAVVRRYVDRLDKGWTLYGELTGRQPSLFKNLNGKPTITAVPTWEVTCGAGCGYVGATGVELALFYKHDYPAILQHPRRFPHYAFYELGRNFFTFGDRHSCFTTGFAVFMRYVCMDTLECEDVEPDLRRHIERMEEAYAASNEPFLRTFTMLDGLDEKAPRLKGKDGKPLDPCDQPVMYAAAMFKLHKDCGGNEWLRKFYQSLAGCPKAKPVDKAAAQKQCLNWLVSASMAAGRDLSGTFCDRWRMPMNKEQRTILATADYRNPDLKPADLVQRLTGDATP